MFWSLLILLVLLIPLVSVILDSELGRALAERLKRGAPALDPALGARVAALETEVEHLTSELQRLEEESEFLQRLLEEKASSSRKLPSGESHG